jgi:hypothetical protein
MSDQPPKLLDQVRHALRLKHYALRTEETYVDWIKRFILFHHKRHPKEMGVPEIEAFLTYLAVEQNAPSTPFAPKNPNICPSSSPSLKPAGSSPNCPSPTN